MKYLFSSTRNGAYYRVINWYFRLTLQYSNTFKVVIYAASRCTFKSQPQNKNIYNIYWSLLQFMTKSTTKFFIFLEWDLIWPITTTLVRLKSVTLLKKTLANLTSILKKKKRVIFFKKITKKSLFYFWQDCWLSMK